MGKATNKVGETDMALDRLPKKFAIAWKSISLRE